MSLAVAVNTRYHGEMKARHPPKPERGIEAIGVEDALRIVLETVRPGPAIERALPEATGFVLAEDVRAPVNLPAFRNSAMDGFALRSVETLGASPRQPAMFRVAGTVVAGDQPWEARLEAKTVVRVMTGAAIPDDADAVVPLEDAEELGDRIGVTRVINGEEHVRAIGSDLAVGEVALKSGTAIAWPEIGLLIAMAVPFVQVHSRPSIAVISTGDELAASSIVGTGRQIPDANGPMLTELIRASGADPCFAGIARDSRAALESLLQGAKSADAIVISGGVSAGDRDIVRALLTDRNAAIFSQVRMKPGRPFTFGVLKDKPLFALPGNPFAAAATFLQFVRPAIDRMRGLTERDADFAVAVSRIENAGKRRLVVPVRLNRGSKALPEAERIADGTAGLALLARADGLLVIPEETAIVNQGDVVRYWRLPV